MARPLDEATRAAICDHMNEDHSDALAGYAVDFGGLSDVRDARMLALDELGMDLAVETPSGSNTARILFDHCLTDADDARETLIAMAKKA